MKKKRIVIVDDDSRNIFALSATLRSRDFECVSFQDARQAIDFLEKDEHVDAVLMDMMMPEMDGYEAIPHIRKIDKRKSTRIISVTAQAMVGDKEKCLDAGADDYISKPIDVDKLVRLLSEI
jgi:CheY-like chemotaxis protein